MPKRKPPSQRPELKKDETAEAIARLREEAKPEKTTKAERLASDNAVSRPGNSIQGSGNRKSTAAPSATTKRQKSGGG